MRWGEWSARGGPRYSRQGAHSHLAPPFAREPQTQPHGGSHTTGFSASASEGPGLRSERRQEEGGTPMHFTPWVGMDSRPGFPRSGCPEAASQSQGGHLVFRFPMPPLSSPQTQGPEWPCTKLWTPIPFKLLSQGARSLYLITDLLRLSQANSPRKRAG